MSRAADRGFGYVWLLFFIAALGISLAMVGSSWADRADRERRDQLTWVGAQYVKAIGSYYESSPRGPKRYPPNLQELLQDSRFAFVRRHIRTLYANPMTGAFDWDVVRDSSGAVIGISAPTQTDGRYIYVPADRIHR